ncbi:hypothetical protein HHL19_12060 [Streptomyces sp. R302]|uniref:hypothetical protein n=1 Tax=unclassified Streptomyces TaxID=2593676 RepID=UPI00145E365A|nr:MULTISPECIES: hypothetical protein [unclassified Streptomyces]NML50394.1 hypothetical protein [Streptomyces sp. R301]NML79385.1 hypothetical protein [Streptomyces sp. R302]
MRRKLALAGLTALALTGCTSFQDPQGPPKPTEPKIAAIPAIHEFKASAVTSPMDDYWPKESEYLALQQAEAILVNKCLKDLGYTKNPQPIPRAVSSTQDYSEMEFPTKDEAAALGYKKPDKSTTDIENSQGAQWDMRADKVQLSLLNGETTSFAGKKVPEGGCTNHVNRALTEGAEPPRTVKSDNGPPLEVIDGQSITPLSAVESLLGLIQYDAAAYTLQDSRTQDMQKKWSGCMKESGFDYKTPGDASGDERWARSSRATGEEIATAKADTECRRKANYLGVMLTVRSAYEKQIIENRAEELTTMKSNLKVWLRNAHAALGR